MKMKVNASTTVKPTMATPTTAVWISNLDVIMPANFHILTVYFYVSTGADDFFDTAVLKASLGRTLVEFYPLAGRLKKDANGRIEIDCNGEGALFVEAECDGTVADEGGSFAETLELGKLIAWHVWRCVSKVRGLPDDQETKLSIPLDGRSRLRPPLPERYFGNVVLKATTIALCGKLESKPLEFAVSKIHEAIARMDDDYLRSAIDYLEMQGCELDPRTRGAASYKCPNLGIVSWARFGFYDANFGWGCPIHLGFGGVPPEGNTIVLPAPANDGSLFFAIVLPKDQMQAFEKLFSSI